MLLGVPKILSGDLLKILCDMGHGDEIVIADANFPAETCGKRVVRCSGVSGVEMAEAMLKVMPLDHLEGSPALLMKVAEGDGCDTPAIWAKYECVLEDAGRCREDLAYLERGEFYDRARCAYAVIQTGEEALYGNIILRKGVVREGCYGE